LGPDFHPDLPHACEEADFYPGLCQAFKKLKRNSGKIEKITLNL
jgi:hypothetical protein